MATVVNDFTANAPKSNLVSPEETKAIMGVFEKMNIYTRSKYNQDFSKTMVNLNAEARKDMAKKMSDNIFASELLRQGENSGFNTNDAVTTASRNSIIKSIKSEFKARAENVLLGSQSLGNYTTAINNMQTLQSVMLYPGVIQATYNKIAKTVVEKKLFYDRLYDAPYLIGHDNKIYDYYGTLRDNEALKKLMGHASPTDVIELPVTNKYVTNVTGVTSTTGALANLIDSYNHGKQTPINGPYNYLNRGIEIVAIGYDEGGTTKQKAVTLITNGNQTQSGEVSDVVATIRLKLSNPSNPTAEPIRINGSVAANGDIDVFCSDDKVKSITFKFNLPVIGMQGAVSIGRKKSQLRFFINEAERFRTTLNQQYIMDSDIMIEDDVIELFNADVITLANQRKDQWTFDWFDDHIKSMKTATVQDFVNTETVLDRYALFADGKVEMNQIMQSAAAAGMEGFMKIHNDMLANEMFKVLNQIELELNPLEKNFVIYSSSLATQWISDMAGNNVTKFNMISDGGDGTIAGLATPYTLNRININNHYTGWFVASNRLRSEKIEIDAPAFGASAKGYGYLHKYRIIPRLEESKDSFIFLSGPEMFTRGTSTPEFVNYEAINYEIRWDLACINKTIGEVEFYESPMAKKH